MKTLRFIIILILFIGIISCDKENFDDSHDINVENYVALLKSNQYDSLNLPPFTYEDIPALLKYINETQIITIFPHNPISSLWGPECELGVYVLWTIESIRAVAINSEYLIMRFPSQNPILELRNSNQYELVYDNISHDIAAKAYFDWWNNNMQKDFDDFKNIDPLANTEYKWH